VLGVPTLIRGPSDDQEAVRRQADGRADDEGEAPLGPGAGEPQVLPWCTCANRSGWPDR